MAGAGFGAGIGGIAPVLGNALKPTVYNDKYVSNAAQSAIDKIQNKLQPIRDAYKAIGKSVIEKLFACIGVCVFAFYFWLEHKK